MNIARNSYSVSKSLGGESTVAWRQRQIPSPSSRRRVQATVASVADHCTTRTVAQAKFSPLRIEEAVRPCLQDCLTTLDSYDPAACSRLASKLADNVKAVVKGLGYTRYKFVVHVHLGESRQQDVRVASRAIMQPACDGVACVTLTHNDMFAVATVYAIYFE